jgi:hypothetical protein
VCVCVGGGGGGRANRLVGAEGKKKKGFKKPPLAAKTPTLFKFKTRVARDFRVLLACYGCGWWCSALPTHNTDARCYRWSQLLSLESTPCRLALMDLHSVIILAHRLAIHCLASDWTPACDVTSGDPVHTTNVCMRWVVVTTTHFSIVANFSNPYSK